MQSKTFIAIVVLLVVVVGGYIFFVQDSNAPVPERPADTQETTDTTVDETSDIGQPTGSDDGSNNDGDDLVAETENGQGEDGASAVATVVYTGSGFSPETVAVSVGDTVRFVNEGDGAMWVASDVHPTHTTYDGTSLSTHCPNTDNDAFDQCGTGETYEFTFERAGEWQYHNHRRANYTGTVIVSEN